MIEVKPHHRRGSSMPVLAYVHELFNVDQCQTSIHQIAHELDVDRSDVYQMTTALREGIVKKAYGDPLKRR
jgi:hypothetical protein